MKNLYEYMAVLGCKFKFWETEEPRSLQRKEREDGSVDKSVSPERVRKKVQSVRTGVNARWTKWPACNSGAWNTKTGTAQSKLASYMNHVGNMWAQLRDPDLMSKGEQWRDS